MERLRKLRREADMTQQQMADYLGVQRTTYTKYEIGTISPSIDTLKKIASLFNVTTDYLIGEAQKNETDEPTDAEPVYTQDDPEFWELREQLRREPGMRTLFSLTKNATSEDMQKMIALIKAYKGDDYDDPC